MACTVYRGLLWFSLMIFLLVICFHPHLTFFKAPLLSLANGKSSAMHDFFFVRAYVSTSIICRYTSSSAMKCRNYQCIEYGPMCQWPQLIIGFLIWLPLARHQAYRLFWYRFQTGIGNRYMHSIMRIL
jgi:hypothetical protein